MQATRQVSPTVEFGRSDESMTKVLVEHGHTVGAITPDSASLSLGTSGTALFLKSYTVAMVTRTCPEDDGMTEFRGARDRIVILGKMCCCSTHVRRPHPGNFLFRNCRQDHHGCQCPRYPSGADEMRPGLSHAGSGWCTLAVHT